MQLKTIEFNIRNNNNKTKICIMIIKFHYKYKDFKQDFTLARSFPTRLIQQFYIGSSSFLPEFNNQYPFTNG